MLDTALDLEMQAAILLSPDQALALLPMAVAVVVDQVVPQALLVAQVAAVTGIILLAEQQLKVVLAVLLAQFYPEMSVEIPLAPMWLVAVAVVHQQLAPMAQLAAVVVVLVALAEKELLTQLLEPP